MKEEWLMSGATVPVDIETTAALVAEIHRLIDIVGSRALTQQRTWQGLTEDEREEIALEVPIDAVSITEAKLKEKNNG